MDTPVAIAVLIIIGLLIAFVVWRSRQSSASGGQSASTPTPPASAPDRLRSAPRGPQAPAKEEKGVFQSAEQRQQKQDKEKAEAQREIQQQGKKRSAEGLFDEPPPIPPPASAPAAPKPAPRQPTPTRSAPPAPEPAPLDDALVMPPDTKQPPPPPPAPVSAAPPAGKSDTGALRRSVDQDEAEPSLDLRGGAAQPEPKPEETAPPIPTEAVRFTSFHPKEVTVDTWYTLLVYAHIEAALSKVQKDAERFKAEMGEMPREARGSAPAQLARGTEIAVVPNMDGVTFNPERISFKWVEDMHRAEFRLKANQDLAGLAGNGTVSILVGPLIVATIRFGMLFNEPSTEPVIPAPKPQEAVTASIYKAEQIFASYSHKDTPVVLACREAYRALGYSVLIDIDNLRSGEDWNAALMNMIERADIFQLFWSERSSQSKFCRDEWEHALKKQKEKGLVGFIRPVYWEKPMPNPPDELAALHFAYVPLPAKPEGSPS